VGGGSRRGHQDEPDGQDRLPPGADPPCCRVGHARSRPASGLSGVARHRPAGARCRPHPGRV